VQIKPDQLARQLKSQIPPVIWVAGDETLLVQETCDLVRNFAREAGFSEREVYSAQNNFDWNSLLEAGNSMSLFAEKKLIDLRLSSSRLDDQAKKALHAYLENPSEDNLLLISSPKVEKAASNTKWFKQIETHAYFVTVWPITAQQLPAWVRQRLQQKGLSADDQAIQVLCQRTEGNLLACAQEIDKLSILNGTGTLDAQTVARAVADSSRFNVFALIDTALEANAGRALNILYHLKAEGEDALKILNFMCREIRNLSVMANLMEAGHSVDSAMQSERVWRNRMGIISIALNNHSLSSLQAMLDHASIIDRSVKGLNTRNTWDELSELTLQLANRALPISA
tara:strand:- start:64877 stop:65899 length:1023 start_codon:yes stop_codon:yes gene_type:complete